MRLFVLATYRDNELSQADALVETLAVLRRHNGVSRIELAGLDDAGCPRALGGHGRADAR